MLAGTPRPDLENGPACPPPGPLHRRKAQPAHHSESLAGAVSSPKSGRDHQGQDRQGQRHASEDLLAKAGFLPPDERALIEALFRDGTSVSRLAAVGGDPRKARRLRRRVRTIVARTLSGHFEVLARLITRGEVARWPRTRRRIAEKLYLEGKTLRRAAAELGVSMYLVRAHRAAIEAILEAARP